MKIDKDLIQHKYAYFGEDKNYELYDIKEIYYPVYKGVINCSFIENEELTRIEEEILKLLQVIKENHIANILNITCIDKDVLGTILSELYYKGYVDKFLQIDNKGKKYLNGIRARKTIEEELCVLFDGILGDILEISESNILVETKTNQNAIELKPNNSARPRNEALNDEFIDDLTLKQVIFESVRNFNKNKNLYKINEINKIGKYFKKHLACFYKNQNEEEKIIVLNDELAIDEGLSRLFENLLELNKFKPRENKADEENKENFNNYNFGIKIEEGAIINECSHGKYLKYTLANAKKDVYIQSPWVRAVVLNEYLDDFKNALLKGVNIHIKYGIKKRNRLDKEPIDDEGLKILDNLSSKYKNFKIYQDNSHEKILICDNDYIINGSFNWLSYKHNYGNERKESSMISKNKDSIMKKIKEFK